jgi:hypothetical protein
MFLRAGLVFGKTELIVNEEGFNGMKWGSDISEFPNLILKEAPYDVIFFIYRSRA